ncbi:MAG: hypothetical protein DYG96_14710 [Chlorobi bacterium CHB2]|nr:hypothetical protein [Chlorobi bacterium CHB2]
MGWGGGFNPVPADGQYKALSGNAEQGFEFRSSFLLKSVLAIQEGGPRHRIRHGITSLFAGNRVSRPRTP